MKYVNMFTVSGAVFALLAAAAVVSVLLPETGVPAQRAVVLPAANVSTASDWRVEVEAVSGTLSDFWGRSTRHADHLWYMENADGTAIVEASGNTLTVYFEDDRPDSVAEVLEGTPADFMSIATAENDPPGESDPQLCGEAETQADCNVYCEPGCEWCLCSARVTCGENGTRYMRCKDDPPECEFECFPPDTPE